MATRRSTRLTATKEEKRDGSEETWDRCAACKPDSTVSSKAKTVWAECEACGTWFHWDCVGEGGDINKVDKWCASCFVRASFSLGLCWRLRSRFYLFWTCTSPRHGYLAHNSEADFNDSSLRYCKSCLANKPGLGITLLPPTRKSNRKRARLDYANIEAGLPSDQSDPNRWMHVIRDKTIHPDTFRRVKGEDLSREWLEQDPLAMTEPIVIENAEGLGMRMPGKEFTVSNVAELVGPDTPVEVMGEYSCVLYILVAHIVSDVASQSTSPGWTLGSWAEYYNTPDDKREKIRNVISLEVTGTPLAEQIIPPRLVREIDWVEHMWPAGKKVKGQFPKVQLYCLMSVARCWTVRHLDRAWQNNH
jgi:hypothetical protein